MQIRMRSALLLASLGALAAMPFAACGSGHTITAGFQELVIGPAGGHGAAQNVQLDVPPGAFTTEHTLAILPQPDPLPIEQPGGCNVEYYHGIMCIGPLGLALGVPGHVQCCYDPSGLPKGSTEQDLVLLEWDDVNQVMKVSLDAVQNLTTHCFDDFSYDFLGHIAVGLCVGNGDSFEFVFLGTPAPSGLVAQAIVAPSPQLLLTDLDGVLPVLPMDGTQDAETYLPSRDGSRVLFTYVDLQADETALDTVDVANTGPLTSRNVLVAGQWFDSDSTFGWLGDQDRIYHERLSFAVQPLEVAPQSESFAAAPGDSTTPIDDLELRPTYFEVEDVRVSPDRSMVLVRWSEFSKGVFTHVDVLDATTGDPIGTDLPTYTPLDGSDDTPRWLPDSSGIYFLEADGVTVTRLDPDGGAVATLYSLNQRSSRILDFVVCPTFAPDPQRCAFVRRDLSFQLAGLTGPIGPDYYATDTLAGDDYVETDLKGQFFVQEMVPLSSDGFRTPLVLVQMQVESFFNAFSAQAILFPSPPDGHTLVFAGGDAAGGASFVADIPAPLAHVDVARNAGFAGQILVWIDKVPASPPGYSTPGIYLLDAQAQNPTLVTPTGFDALGPPRWLHSWRFAAGFDAFTPRVR